MLSCAFSRFAIIKLFFLTETACFGLSCCFEK
jgi:hypothetical protein